MKRMVNNAENLENFLFLSEDFNFQNEETIENASQDKLYFKIVNEIIKGSKNSKSAPLIIFDKYSGNIYIGYVSDDSTAYATYIASNANSILEFDYHGDTDVLNIYLHDEVYVTADNVKTIFGQDIAGTGNITMYRHNLKISHNRTGYDDQKHDIFLTYYSSNNLEANTPEKLTTLTKATNGTNLRSPVYSIITSGSSDYDKVSLYYIGAMYNGSAWNLMNSNGTSSSIAINSVTDTVEPV